MKQPRSTNYTYYVEKKGPCKRCGFSGRVNDWREAERLGEVQCLVACPECGGAGFHAESVDLTSALADLEKRGMELEDIARADVLSADVLVSALKETRE